MFSLPNHLEIVFVHGGGDFAAISALKAALRAGEDARPYEMGESSGFAVGASAIPEPTLIRLACARHLPPYRGKACGRPQGPPLRREQDRERWLGKARRRCKTAPALIFLKFRPLWAGRNRGMPLRFCAPEGLYSLQGVTP